MPSAAKTSARAPRTVAVPAASAPTLDASSEPSAAGPPRKEVAQKEAAKHEAAKHEAAKHEAAKHEAAPAGSPPAGVAGPPKGPAKGARRVLQPLDAEGAGHSTDSVALYLREIARYPRLTRGDEARLSALAMEGDPEAQTTLVQCNLKLVVSICKDFTRSRFDLLELVSAGNEGLMVASRKYDWRLGVPFANYAAYWIKQRLMKYVAEHGFAVRVPPYRAAIVNKVVRVHTRLSTLLGRSPGADEVARETGHTMAEVAEVMQMMQPAMELDAPLGDGEGSGSIGGAFGESAAEADARATGLLRTMELQDAVKDALAVVPERERAVLVWYFGLDGVTVTDLDEIARRLGVTRERARQIKAAALKRLADLPDLRSCWDS